LIPNGQQCAAMAWVTEKIEGEPFRVLRKELLPECHLSPRQQTHDLDEP
jgi:hypothetical protein